VSERHRWAVVGFKEPNNFLVSRITVISRISSEMSKRFSCYDFNLKKTRNDCFLFVVVNALTHVNLIYCQSRIATGHSLKTSECWQDCSTFVWRAIGGSEQDIRCFSYVFFPIFVRRAHCTQSGATLFRTRLFRAGYC